MARRASTTRGRAARVAQSATEPLAERGKRLRAALKPIAVTHLLVTDPKDVGYLTGFHGGDSALIFPAQGRAKPVLISDRRYEEELSAFAGSVAVRMRSGSMLDEVAAVCGALEIAKGGAGSLGVQAEHVSLAMHGELAKRVGVKRVVATSGVVAGLRLVKAAGEVALIRKAIRVQEAALEVTLGDIAAGQTELDVCAQLEWAMKSMGATGLGFSTIIAAGGNSAKPHYHPGNVKLKRNSVLLIDFGASVGGYTGDMTRTFALGRWPGAMAEVYDVVREAHELAAAALAPGKSGAEIDAVARAHITSRGYGEQFAHSLGHGIGLNVHEGPRLSSMAHDDVLKPGMVVTIEPGVYLPGLGGVRLENDYLVTERGGKNLCSLPMDRRWATLA